MANYCLCTIILLVKCSVYVCCAYLTYAHYDGWIFNIIAFSMHPVLEICTALEHLKLKNRYSRFCRLSFIHVSLHYIFVVVVYQIVKLFEKFNWDIHKAVFNHREGSELTSLLITAARILVVEYIIDCKDDRSYATEEEEEPPADKCIMMKYIGLLILELFFLGVFIALSYHTYVSESHHVVDGIKNGS